MQHNVKMQGMLHPWWRQFGKQQALSDKPTRIVTKSVAPDLATHLQPSAKFLPCLLYVYSTAILLHLCV